MNSLPDEWRVIVALWTEVSADGSFPPAAPYAASAIARAFDSERLDAAQRGFIVATLHALLAGFRRLDFALEPFLDASAIGTPEYSLALAAAAALERGLIEPVEARILVPDVNWDAVSKFSERLPSIADPLARFATEHSLPNYLAERLRRDFSDDAGPLALSLGVRPATTIRVNTLKCKPADLSASLGERGIETRPAAWFGDCLEVPNPDGLFKTASFRDGLFEVQDEGSRWVAEVAAPPPHGRILDACAGAGGKTLALSALMSAHGTLIATDISDAKLDTLRTRARRAHAFNVRALRSETESWAAPIEALSGRFDRVLVDAPCSGTGSLRRKPEIRWRLAEPDIAHFATLQRQIAGRAAKLLAPKGRLIYATCSLLREENEDVVESLCESEKLVALPLKEIIGSARAAKVASADGRFLKLLPHRHGTDGFFAAVLKKAP